MKPTQFDDLTDVATILTLTLGMVEWVSDDDTNKLYCPWCLEWIGAGHAKDCRRERTFKVLDEYKKKWGLS